MGLKHFENILVTKTWQGSRFNRELGFFPRESVGYRESTAGRAKECGIGLIALLLGLLSLGGCAGGCQKKENANGRSGELFSPPAPAEAPPAPLAGANKVALETTISDAEKYGLDQTLPVVGMVTDSVHGVEAKTAGTLAIETRLASDPGGHGISLSDRLNDSERLSFGLLGDDSCSGGSLTVKLIGSGYEMARDVAYTGGLFKVDRVPTKNEAMLELSCGLRCLIQAGQRGVLCNQIADSVLGAFEVALGRSIYDPHFSGVRLAKVLSAIVDASQIKGDETDSFKKTIADCNKNFQGHAKNDCYRTSIKNSPFYPAFKILEQLVQGWSAEGLYSFVTTVLGAKVEVDSELYSWIMDSVEKSLETNFVTETRNLLADVIRSQNAQEAKYPFQVVCAIDLNNNGAKKFKPDLSADKKISCDRQQATKILHNAGIDPSHHEAILSDRLRESVPCSAPEGNMQNGQRRCWVRLATYVESLVQEVDRNDPSGTKRSWQGRSIHMVEVMPQVMLDLQRDAQIPMDGDVNVDQFTEVQRTMIKQIIAKRRDYFLGLIGLYRMLNDPSLRSIKLSLRDLHEIFTDQRFLNSRLVAWGQGLSGLRVRDPARPQDTWYLEPLLSPVSGQKQVMGVDNLFRFDPAQGYQEREVSPAIAKTLKEKSRLEFHHTFETFLRIPTSREMERFIFDASRHEEWNPIGNRFLYVAQLRDTGKPLFCKMTNHGPNFTMTALTKIECHLNPSQVTCGTGQLEEGQCKFPPDYDYPFVLLERGWFGEDQGRLFMLASRTTGRFIGAGGDGQDGITVREVRPGNSVGECDPTQVGQVVQYIAKFQCGDNKVCENNVTAYCMDLSLYGKPARKRFYPGGTHKVSFVNTQTGESHTWEVPRIGVHTAGTEHSSNASACLHVPTGTFVPSGSTNSQLVTLRVNGEGFLNISGLSVASIKDCGSDAEAGFEKYLLYNWRDFGETETAFAFLMTTRNETLMWSFNPVTDQQWERNYARLSVAQIESLTPGKKVMGTPQPNIDGMRYINPAHDPKFDPYCDDTNGNGECDCYAMENTSADGQEATFSKEVRSDPRQCGLRDKAAEPTVAQLPYCAMCPDGAKAAEFFQKFGGKSGSDLAPASSFFNGSWPPFDLNSSALCLHRFAGETKRRSPRWVNFSDLGGNQQGCPELDGAVRGDNNAGPIRVMKPRPMNNAFLIDRPRQVLQLANYALKNVEQGVSLDINDARFTADEAYAFLQLRLLMPPDRLTVSDSSGKSIPEVSVLYRNLDDGDDSVDVISGGLKGILFKGGRLSEQDLAVKRSEGKP